MFEAEADGHPVTFVGGMAWVTCVFGAEADGPPATFEGGMAWVTCVFGAEADGPPVTFEGGMACMVFEPGIAGMATNISFFFVLRSCQSEIKLQCNIHCWCVSR